MLRLGEVASRVAHDFANLAMVMREQIAMARADLPVGHSAGESLAAASLAAQQAADLTDALRQWTHGVRQIPKPVNLTEELALWGAFVEGMVPASVVFASDLPVLPPMWIDADVVALKRVLANLVRNACEAMPRGGRLTFRVARVGKEGHAELLVRLQDTGCGMSPEVCAKVFNPFFSTKRALSGRGLGMAIVHEVIDLHGGRVEIDSAPNRGTRVTLRLPVRAVEDESPPAPAVGRRVLVVAADRLLARRVRATLEPAGFRVACASWKRGEDVVVSLRQHPPHAFVLDVDSTPQRELEQVLRLNRRSSACSAVMLLRRAGSVLRRRLSDREYLLYKPFDASELRGCVARSMLME